jgi:hypothetical protein
MVSVLPSIYGGRSVLRRYKGNPLGNTVDAIRSARRIAIE